MDLGLQIAASGMVAEQVRQDQLSNDLANATTPGYKPDKAPQHNFDEVLLANSPGAPSVGGVDAYVALGKTYTDMSAGTVLDTGEPLDFALIGEGFFGVKTPQGVRYTRNGQFLANNENVLTDSTGNPVLGQSGAPVKVTNGKVEASAVGVFSVPDAAKQGENLWTGTPSGKSTATVRQGALEESGVDAAKIMIEMISSLRNFQSGQQAIQTIGQTLQEASTQVGSLNPNG
ncbi:MAG TPA: flagellar hook-basal body protein [Solirubrobacteraceae bacterium]|nr:flagellar hook-basal body protein [Solirubrobacteraceae bacterium]